MEVQGHRGARGLMAENTLASFEIALDVGVDSIETDVHLSKDGVPVLFHDAEISERICPGQANGKPLVRSLTVAELRSFRVREHLCTDRSWSERTTIAEQFAAARGVDAFGIPTLAEFFDFVKAYANSAEKTPAQQECARRLVFDIELKRVPFQPQTIGDDFDGITPALLELNVVAAIREAAIVERTRVRSFDHRSVVAIRQLEPRLTTGVIIHHTALAHAGLILDAAQAELYCPDFQFVDADLVRRVHEAGKRIMPYTVNEADDWRRLAEMGVDGITTDYPDRLRHWLGLARA